MQSHEYFNLSDIGIYFIKLNLYERKFDIRIVTNSPFKFRNNNNII